MNTMRQAVQRFIPLQSAQQNIKTLSNRESVKQLLAKIDQAKLAVEGESFQVTVWQMPPSNRYLTIQKATPDKPVNTVRY